jgi:hypothetical protein
VERIYVKDLDTLGTLLEEVKPGDLAQIGIIRGNVAAWVQIRARAESPASTPAVSQPSATPKGMI